MYARTPSASAVAFELSLGYAVIDDRAQRRLVRSHESQHRQPVDAGEVLVDDEDVVLLAREPNESLLAALDDIHRVPRVPEDARQQVPHPRLIVHDEHAAGVDRSPAHVGEDTRT